MRQGQITTGSRTCGFIVTDDPETLCGQPAIGHFMWDNSGDNGVACEIHTPYAMAHAVDWHILVDDCTMPGVHWVYSTSDGCGRCEWPQQEEATVETDVGAELVAP